MSSKLAIIDYGMGNLHSVSSAVQHVADDVDVDITADHKVIQAADRVIFPGVGAIRDCVGEIRRLGFDRLVLDEIASGKPVLAICVGLQALMRSSEENGGVECLGHFDGEVKFFSDDPKFKLASSAHKLKVPHMGWNQVNQSIKHPLWSGIPDATRFYFVHSYFVELNDSSFEAGQSHYGRDFSSVLAQGNVFATQFHPEKSHEAGLALLRNFVTWDGKF